MRSRGTDGRCRRYDIDLSFRREHGDGDSLDSNMRLRMGRGIRERTLR